MTMNATRTRNWKKKLTVWARMAERGRISRGNATLGTSSALETTDSVVPWRPVENRVQGRRPDRRYTGKSGIGLFRSTENTREKTTRYRMGLSIDHRTPRTDDL